MLSDCGLRFVRKRQVESKFLEPPLGKCAEFWPIDCVMLSARMVQCDWEMNVSH